MRVKVKLIGKGTEDDPYRVPLPTYIILSIDYKTKTAVVELPDEFFIHWDEERKEWVKKDTLNIERLRILYHRWYEGEKKRLGREPKHSDYIL